MEITIRNLGSQRLFPTSSGARTSLFHRTSASELHKLFKIAKNRKNAKNRKKAKNAKIEKIAKPTHLRV